MMKNEIMIKLPALFVAGGDLFEKVVHFVLCEKSTNEKA